MESQFARHRKDALRYFPENASAIVICLSAARDVIKAEVVATADVRRAKLSSCYYSGASDSILVFVVLFVVLLFIIFYQSQTPTKERDCLIVYHFFPANFL